MDKKDLVDFEEDIASIYETGKIRAPIHLRSGNEEPLIEIFKNIKDEDYVYSTWASHLHSLLKGVPSDVVKDAILEGRSITLNFPEYNLYSSAIVGGTPSIAVGTAYALQKQNKAGRVYCFLGDMGFHTGIAYESIKYAIGHNLPITFVVEDNEKSVGTPTFNTWYMTTYSVYELMCKMAHGSKNVKIEYYKYESKYPHAGTGTFVEF
jgi:pyruvate dehydrogenase E1 component alpha subunit